MILQVTKCSYVPEKRLSANLNSKLLFPTPENRFDKKWETMKLVVEWS